MASLHDYSLITYRLLVDVPDIWVIANLQIMLGVAMQLISALTKHSIYQGVEILLDQWLHSLESRAEVKHQPDGPLSSTTGFASYLCLCCPVTGLICFPMVVHDHDVVTLSKVN